MKYLTSSFSSFLSKIAAALIGILGFSSCSSEEYMYGTPTSSFEVKGRVFTEEGYLFQGAEITASNPNNPDSPYETFGPVESDAQGRYSIAGSINSNVIKIVCVAPDGSYQSDEVYISLNYIKDKDQKKNPWEAGHASATVDITLKRASTE